MSSYDSQSIQHAYGLRQDGTHLSMTPNQDGSNTFNFPLFSNTNIFPDTSTVQYQPSSNSSSGAEFYQQTQVPSSVYSQQQNPSFSNLPSLACGYQGDTSQGHLSPASYVQDFASPNQYDANNLVDPFANAQLQSPLSTNDDGRGGYLTPDFASHVSSSFDLNHNNNSGYFDNTTTAALDVASYSPHSATPLSDPSLFATSRASNLSLHVPLFDSTSYGDSGSARNSSLDVSDLQHMKSPVVTLSRSPSRRSQGNNFLSPYHAGDSSGDEDWSVQSTGHRSSCTTTRDEDGAWVPATERGTGGLSPIERIAFNQEVPTINEEEKLRDRSEKNAHVKDWLSVSANISTRRRAKSDTTGLQNQQASCQYQLSHLQPGPGAIINESSIYDDDEEEQESASVQTSSGAVSESPAISAAPFVGANLSSTTAYPRAGTSNGAMMAYALRTKQKDMDEASITGTIGTMNSRRRSFSEIGSLWSQDGISRQITVHEDKGKKGISGFFSDLMPTRTLSRGNSRKRKSDANNDSTITLSATSQSDMSATIPAASGQGRMSNLLSRPRTPKLDTDLPINRTSSRSPLTARLSKIRSRSKSDIGNIQPSELAGLWKQHGGPPVAYHAAPSQSYPGLPVQGAEVKMSGDDSDEEDEGVDMDLSVRLDMTVIPTIDGFRQQIKDLNPRIDHDILERLVNEQVERYKRLVKARTQHSTKSANGKCDSRHLCALRGGQPEPIVAKSGAKATLPIFQIVPAGTNLESLGLTGDTQAAVFREGVPQPPVHTLPCRFECPYCFAAKDFKKPSDWTKHIHEDVQPFTCTFPECTDSKSFKRKADWVRHESERHRQLESWNCAFEDCTHVCYRRDNFVQHLVREHKVPELKIRTGRSGGPKSQAWSPNTPIDIGDGNGARLFQSEDQVNRAVAKHVENCHSESCREPSTEPCRFCGNILKSWKQLTVHLAKHMEQIAMPIIPLIEQHPTARNASFSFAQSSVQQMPAGIMASHPSIPISIPSGPYLYDEPSEIENANTPTIAISGPNIQYSFPPNNYSSLLLEPDMFASSINGASFPPPSLGSRSRGSSFGEGQGFQRLDSTYPLLNMMSSDFAGNIGQTMILTSEEQQNRLDQHNQQSQQNQYMQHNQKFHDIGMQQYNA